MGIVLLRRLIEEYTPNREIRVRRYRRPSCIGLDILAEERNIPRRIRGMDIPQEAHIGVRDEVWDFAGIIRIWQSIWSWAVAGVDYDGKIDIGVGRDPGGVLATLDPCLWFTNLFLLLPAWFVLRSAWLAPKWPLDPCRECGGLPAAWEAGLGV